MLDSFDLSTQDAKEIKRFTQYLQIQSAKKAAVPGTEFAIKALEMAFELQVLEEDGKPYAI